MLTRPAPTKGFRLFNARTGRLQTSQRRNPAGRTRSVFCALQADGGVCQSAGQYALSRDVARRAVRPSATTNMRALSETSPASVNSMSSCDTAVLSWLRLICSRLGVWCQMVMGRVMGRAVMEKCCAGDEDSPKNRFHQRFPA